MTQLLVKNCLRCGKTIRGRTDKKFCDDYCRNVHNNLLNAPTNSFMRDINSTLRKNRTILDRLIGERQQMNRVSRELLLNEGFKFQYYTHSVTNNRGQTYCYCYDVGYFTMNDGFILIVRDKHE